MSQYKRLRPPPRFVALPIRIYALFGGVFNLIGWILLSFSFIFVWIFLVDSGWNSFFTFRGEIVTTPGIITDVYDTNAEENEYDVVAHDYTFTVNGVNYSGTSYITARESPEGPATIEYIANQPEKSRIQGMRRETFSQSFLMLFILLFPLIGLVFVIGGMRRGIKANRLLVHGVFAFGELIDKKPTGTTVNDMPEYKMIFEYKVKGQIYNCSAKTTEPEELEDDEKEALLYNPRSPEDSIMFDSLPGYPYVDASGGLKCESPGKSLLYLIAPLLTIIFYGFAGFSLFA